MKQSKTFTRTLALLMVLAVTLLTCLPAGAAVWTGATVNRYVKASGQKMMSLKGNKETAQYFYGDANLDGEVNTGDATLILRYSAQSERFISLQLTLSDANLDGEVNTGDASYVLKLSLGLIPMASIDVTLPAYYTLNFSAGEGMSNVEGVPTEIKMDAGDTYAFENTHTTCAGYLFMGWKSDYDNITYGMGDTLIMPNANVTLTAVWREDKPICAVTVILENAINGSKVDEYLMEITGNIRLDKSNVTMPEGYKPVAHQTYEITVKDGVCSPGAVTFKVYAYKTIDGKDFVRVNEPAAFDFMRSNLKLNYVLESNIDMSCFGTKFVPIGYTANGTIEGFTGIFDGKGFKIYNFTADYWGDTSLTPNREYPVGLIATNKGILRNIVLQTTVPDTAKAGQYGVYGFRDVGALCGINASAGTIDNCRISGCVGTYDQTFDDEVKHMNSGGAGGITGFNFGIIKHSYAVVSMDAYFWAGGLAGRNWGTIEESWGGAAINSQVPDEYLMENYVLCMGGLCGGTSKVIRNCYAFVLGIIQGNGCCGGIAGYCRNGILDTIFVAIIEGGLGGYNNVNLACGYCAEDPEIQRGLYNFTNGIDELFEEYSPDIWDFNGTTYKAIPNLKNCPRPLTMPVYINSRIK